MLYHDFLTNDRKLIHKWLHYFPIYDRYFKKFQNQSVIFWEIGVSEGGSLQMWKRYLGPFAKIVGIDINPECQRHEEDQIHICIGDQSDTSFLQEVIDKHGYPDVVLDDGSHIMQHVCATFDFLYDKVSKNGVYFVEDLQTAYYPSYGGGLKQEGTFIELCKSLIDSLNARHCGLPSSFAESTFSMSFYDSVAVFERIQWLNDNHKTKKTSGKTKAMEIWYDVIYDILEKADTNSIYLYGTGAYARNFLNMLPYIYKNRIAGLLSADTEETGKYLYGYKVYELEEIIGECSTILIAASESFQNIVYDRIKHLESDGVKIIRIWPNV